MLDNKNIINALNELGLSQDEVNGLDAVFDKRRDKVTSLLTYFSEQKEPPLDVVVTGAVTLSNISLAMLDINPNKDEDFTDTCLNLLNTFKEEEIEDEVAIAILFTSAAMIAGGMDLEAYLKTIFRKKAREKMKAKKSTLSKTTINIKKKVPKEDVFEDGMEEEELARRIVDILKSMDK